MKSAMLKNSKVMQITIALEWVITESVLKLMMA
jgi:hypothetical protein